MKRTTIVTRTATLLLLSAIALSSARAGSGGSAYSIFGVGDLRHAMGLRSTGMGYTGLGLYSQNSINGFSPASWSQITRVRLEASVLYEGFGSTDGTRSRFLARTDFSGALLAIPIATGNGITLVGGFLPFSSVNYDAYTRGGTVSGIDTLDYSIHHIGTGGITRGVIGLSYAPAADWSVGFSTDVLFGSIDSEENLIPTSTSYEGGQLVDQTTMNGVAFTLGTLYSGLGSLSPALKPFSIGATVTSRAVLSARNQTTYRFTTSESSTERDTSGEVERTTTIPLSWSVGVACQAGERMVFAADYSAQAWSGTLVNDRAQTSLRDSYRFGIGMERLPARTPYGSWLDHSALRLGAYFAATYFQPNGEPINEWGVTAGAGVPFSGDSRLNLALEYAQRGTTGKGLVKDQIIRFSASVSIGALWFVQYPED
jgi:hypothetical protein